MCFTIKNQFITQGITTEAKPIIQKIPERTP